MTLEVKVARKQVERLSKKGSFPPICSYFPQQKASSYFKSSKGKPLGYHTIKKAPPKRPKHATPCFLAFKHQECAESVTMAEKLLGINPGVWELKGKPFGRCENLTRELPGEVPFWSSTSPNQKKTPGGNFGIMLFLILLQKVVGGGSGYIVLKSAWKGSNYTQWSLGCAIS